MIVVQIPNKSEKLQDDVERWFETQGVTYENGQLSLYGYTSNCNIKLNIQVSVCFCKEAGAHFFACLQKILKISGKIRKKFGKEKVKGEIFKAEEKLSETPPQTPPLF